jgi:hypothetical protein
LRPAALPILRVQMVSEPKTWRHPCMELMWARPPRVPRLTSGSLPDDLNNRFVVPMSFVKASLPLGDFHQVLPLQHSPSPLLPSRLRSPSRSCPCLAFRNETAAIFLRPLCLHPPEDEEVAQLRRARLPARNAARSLSAVSRLPGLRSPLSPSGGNYTSGATQRNAS